MIAGVTGVAAVVVMAALVVVPWGAEEGSRAKAPWVARRSKADRLGMVCV